MFDHFHAVVRTICAKLRRSPETSPDDRVGGSTYSFEVWEGHPLEEEVLDSLRRFRRANTELRERVRAVNRNHPKPRATIGVVVYGGQTSWGMEEEKNDDTNI